MEWFVAIFALKMRTAHWVIRKEWKKWRGFSHCQIVRRFLHIFATGARPELFTKFQKPDKKRYRLVGRGVICKNHEFICFLWEAAAIYKF